MTVQLKAQFVKAVPSEGVYRVQVDIIDAVSIDFDVLVFDVETDAFKHVATVYDLETWSIDKTTAIANGHAYYRGRGATVYYDTVAKATNFVTVTESRLQLLVSHWDEVTIAFEGTDIVSVSSDTTS